MTITVLVADDQPLMRTAIRMTLEAEPDIEVVGEASDGRQAVELATRLDPDVVMMDIRMPGLDGIAAARLLTDASRMPPVKVLMMTTFDLDEYLLQGLRAGASGFILKNTTSDELVHAVRVVASGEALLAPAVTRWLLEWCAPHLAEAAPDAAPVLGKLTERERAVLLLVAEGLSNAAIAERLHLAESSVKTHVSHLLAKLDRQDRVQLVIFAYEAGLVPSARGVSPAPPA